MRTILVDEDGLSRELFATHIELIRDIELVGQFADPFQALTYAREHMIEFAVLDIEMHGNNGLDLGQELKVLYPDIILVYITSNTQHVIEAMKTKADYCIIKPFNRKDIVDAAQRVKKLTCKHKKVRAVMFGRFQLFVGDELVYFSNAKSKELLALCLDHRGGEVTMQEAIDKLWPDRIYDEKVKKLYRKAVMILQATLKEVGAEEIFAAKRGSCYANIAEIECDYYQFLKTRGNGNSLYDGKYLFDYGWGEETLAMLERIVD